MREKDFIVKLKEGLPYILLGFLLASIREIINLIHNI